MTNLNYTCVKCSHHQYETGEIRATGGTLSKIFDIQNEKFSYVACQQCKYTEFYKADTGALSNIFDFFTG
jgi:hypothetical protein